MSILSYLVKPLAYLSAPYVVLQTAAQASPMARYYARLYLYLSTLGLCSIWGACVAIVMSAAGRRFDVNYYVARSFAYISAHTVGIRFQVEGEQHLDTRPAVIVGNHQSMLDIAYLGRYDSYAPAYPSTDDRSGFFRNGLLSWLRRNYSGCPSSGSICPCPELSLSTAATTPRLFVR
jgi:hypothetical protein